MPWNPYLEEWAAANGSRVRGWICCSELGSDRSEYRMVACWRDDEDNRLQIRDHLSRKYAFGVPGNDALDCLARYGPSSKSAPAPDTGLVACASEAWISSPTTSWVTHGAPGSVHPSWRRFDAAAPVRLWLGRTRSARSLCSGRRSSKAVRKSFGAMLSEPSCCAGRIRGAVLTKPRCSPTRANTSRCSVNRARKDLGVGAFRRGCGGPGGGSRQYPSPDGIHPRIGYLSTRDAEGKSPDGSLCYLDHRPDERATGRSLDSFLTRHGVCASCDLAVIQRRWIEVRIRHGLAKEAG